MSTGTTTGRFVSTGAAIHALMQQAQSRVHPLIGKRPSMIVMDERMYDKTRRYWDIDYQDANYFFGAALLAVKHPRAKEYHKLTQRGKSRMRAEYELKMASNHPHMAKYKELARHYAVHKVAGKLEKA